VLELNVSSMDMNSKKIGSDHFSVLGKNGSVVILLVIKLACSA